MLTRLFTTAGTIAAGSILCITSPASAQWTVTDLTPSGATSAFALGNSGANQVGQSGSFAAIWSGTSASYASLNPSMFINTVLAPADGSRCNAAFGTQQGGFARWTTKTYAGVWSGSAASWVNLHPGGVGAAGNSIVYGLCATQQVGTYDALGTHATLWTGAPESYVDLSPLTTPYGAPSSSSARGTNGTFQVGYISRNPPGVNHASLWAGTPESYVDLTPGGSAASDSMAFAISADGTQVVGYFGASLGTSNQRATLWTSGDSWATWTSSSLHPLAGATSSQALANTNSEQVGYAVVGGTEHASLWHGSAGTWVDLHPLLSGLGVSRSKAWGIWTDGVTTKIAGECWTVDAANPTIRTGTKPFLLTRVQCPADLDNGSGVGTPDGGVDINDLLYFLTKFEEGAVAADLDNGSGTGTPDGGVDINDLLYFLLRFEAGC